MDASGIEPEVAARLQSWTVNSMGDVCFFGGTAILPDRLLEDAVVVCREGRIAYVGTAKSKIPRDALAVDVRGGYLCPGFVDLHIHGGGGADFMDGTAEAVTQVCRSHARHGTTTLFPTTTTGSQLQIQAMIDACKCVRDAWTIADGARIGGVHLYGPYFAPDKVGCHSRDECRPPMAREYQRYFRSGLIRIATCAAELPGAADFYRAASRHECLVTCGHSNASWSEMEVAFRYGMRHVDHFWCAMSSVSSVRTRFGFPMQASMMEFVLAQPEMSTEVIADGKHLTAELLRFAWHMKSSERLCLVTDCNRALDMPPGEYRFGPDADGPSFVSDGTVGWASPDALASSVRGMDFMVQTMHRDAGVPLFEAVRMASLTPAERVGMQHEVGSLQVGKRADLLWLNRRLQLRQTYIQGVKFPLRKPSGK
jgi:N-acetylglucosamine-6-phosphate deacetylase